MYDWAITGMWAVVVATVFPIYFQSVAAADLPPTQATQYFATATTLGMVIIGLLAPIMGAVTDYLPVKKKMLTAFMALGVASSILLFFVEQGDWFLGLVLFILVNMGANGSTVFYDSLLPHIAREEEMDRVSSGGFAVGYLGAGLLLTGCLVLIAQPTWFGIPEGSTLPARLSFVAVGVWWGLFTIPLLLRVSEPVPVLDPSRDPGSGIVRSAVARLMATLRDLRGYRNAFLMLVAFLIYNDGIGTVIRMAAIYGAELGIDSSALIGAVVMVQFVGVPATFLFGMLAGRVGTRPAIFAGLVLYLCIVLLAFVMRTAFHFYLLAFLVGLVQGGTQGLSRSLFATMIPRSKSGEFFGFFAVMEKFSGMAGPAIIAVTIAWTGSSRLGILSVAVFFLVGGALLALVRVEEGRSHARGEELRIRERARTPSLL